MNETDQAIVNDWAEKIIAQVDKDIITGFPWGKRIPPDVDSFSELHDYCDANQVYLLDIMPEIAGTIGDDEAGRRALAISNAVTDEVSERLAERAMSNWAGSLLTMIETEQTYGRIPRAVAPTAGIPSGVLAQKMLTLGLGGWNADAVRLLADVTLAVRYEHWHRVEDSNVLRWDAMSGAMSLGMFREATKHLPDEMLIVTARGGAFAPEDERLDPVNLVQTGRFDFDHYHGSGDPGAFTEDRPADANAICFWPAD